MIIKVKEKTWAQRNVKIRFAFIPLSLSTGYYVWLERYYVYDNYQSIWRSPKKCYIDKQQFYNKIVLMEVN